MVTCGQDSNKDVYPILVDSSGRPYVLLSDGTETLNIDSSNRAEVSVLNVKPDGTNTLPAMDATGRKGFVKLTNGTNDIDTTTYDGITSLRTTPGRTNEFHIYCEAVALAVSKGFMLVDLSDTSNWPHTNTDHIHILHALVNIIASKDAVVDLELAFLSDVDASNGNINILHAWQVGVAGTNERTSIVDNIIFPYGGIECQTTNWFGPTHIDSALFQTDVNLKGPDGNTSFPAGDGDLVLHVTVTSGTIGFGIHIGYVTDA